jgi:DNA-binding SARP family transcriptional activator
MFVRVLGPVSAGRRAEDLVPVSGQIGAAVLAHLALAGGRWISSEALIAQIWDDAPTSARNAIQVAVSKLRKQFGAELLRSSPHGYAVDSAQVTTDWHEAVRLVTDSRRHLDVGAAAAEAAAAIEIFQGEPLLGLSSPSVDAIRRSAQELLDSAREASARALMTLQQPVQAAAAIQPVCDADPLNEPAQLLQIEAFAAAGRLAAALASYDQLRRALADELGVDPSPATQAVFARLLRSDAKQPFQRMPSPATGAS